MNVTEITMDKDQAKEAFEAYRREVGKRHYHEDEAIMRGFRALARGKRLLHLSQTIKAGGTETHPRRNWQGTVTGSVVLPRLAVCRANAQWCWISTEVDGACAFAEALRPDHRARKNVRRLPADTLPRAAYNDLSHYNFKAMVPVVPAALRPAHHLQNYHVLWEADWTAHPPVDPYLLKYIGGDLYAILASWDLTELERAVMSERVN